MNTKNIKERLDLALLIAKKAGAFVLEAEKKGNFVVKEKDANDFVTEVDSSCEELIVSMIRETFPLDGIFGEEGGTQGPVDNGRWVIDPIDGTTNFLRSIPGYTVSIAWEIEPYKPLVGVVFNPRQDELFWASKGGGAFLNGAAITVSSVEDPQYALLAYSPPHRHHELTQAYFESAQRIFLGSSDLRSYGSCALELCYIAAGRLDGYYELALGYYDLAAGLCIVEEAGGKGSTANPNITFSDYRCDLIASNGLIHEWLFHMVSP